MAVRKFTMATERKVRRFYGNLTLKVDRDSIVTDRVERGQMPFLINHDPNKLVGRVD